MNKYKIQHFTLLELLLVMGLMALMVSFALPAFSRMTGNNKVDINNNFCTYCGNKINLQMQGIENYSLKENMKFNETFSFNTV